MLIKTDITHLKISVESKQHSDFKLTFIYEKFINKPVRNLI